MSEINQPQEEASMPPLMAEPEMYQGQEPQPQASNVGEQVAPQPEAVADPEMHQAQIQENNPSEQVMPGRMEQVEKHRDLLKTKREHLKQAESAEAGNYGEQKRMEKRLDGLRSEEREIILAIKRLQLAVRDVQQNKQAIINDITKVEGYIRKLKDEEYHDSLPRL